MRQSNGYGNADADAKGSRSVDGRLMALAGCGSSWLADPVLGLRPPSSTRPYLLVRRGLLREEGQQGHRLYRSCSQNERENSRERARTLGQLRRTNGKDERKRGARGAQCCKVRLTVRLLHLAIISRTPRRKFPRETSDNSCQGSFEPDAAGPL